MYFDLGDEFDKTLETEKCETWDVSTLNGDNDITMIGLGGNYGHEYKPAHRYYPLGIRPYKGTDTDKDHATGAMGSKTNVQPYVNNILPDKLGYLRPMFHTFQSPVFYQIRHPSRNTFFLVFLRLVFPVLGIPCYGLLYTRVRLPYYALL
jgi:hypothetical protein